MATLQRPRLLLIDEHTAALDPRTAEQVLALTHAPMRRVHQTAVMVPHYMKHVIELGNRSIAMHPGRIVFDVGREAKERLTIQDLRSESSALHTGKLADPKLLLVC